MVEQRNANIDSRLSCGDTVRFHLQLDKRPNNFDKRKTEIRNDQGNILKPKDQLILACLVLSVATSKQYSFKKKLQLKSECIKKNAFN